MSVKCAKPWTQVTPPSPGAGGMSSAPTGSELSEESIVPDHQGTDTDWVTAGGHPATLASSRGHHIARLQTPGVSA